MVKSKNDSHKKVELKTFECFFQIFKNKDNDKKRQ